MAYAAGHVTGTLLSYLREIMERLKERAEADRRSQAVPAEPLAAGSTGEKVPALSGAVEQHISSYRQHLNACSDAMLLYEWAWIDDHLSSLRLSLGHEPMRQALGGSTAVDQLLQETDAFRQALREVMQARDLEPSNRTAPIEPMEHAWEVSHPVIREAWGIEAQS